MKLIHHSKCMLFSAAATMALAYAFTSAESPPARVALTSSARLRVVTYNVQLLPLEILNKRSSAAYRVQRQVEKLANYDIVGLNEVFRSARRAELLMAMQRAWGEEFQVVAPNRSDCTVFGLDSGLLLLTRLPVLESHTLTFDNDSLIRERGPIADGYARKGAIHARVHYTAPSGKVSNIDCFVTHLESVDASRREAQFTLLADFIKQHQAPQNPILLLGDFNTIGNRDEIANKNSSYWRLRRALSMAHAGWQDVGESHESELWGTANADSATGDDRIDYIFLANSTQDSSLIPLRAAVQSFPDPLVGYLSDHCAVEAEFELKE